MADKAEATSPEQLKRSLEFQVRLNKITKAVHDGGPLAEVMPQVMPELLKLLSAERVTVYQRGRNDAEIVSRFKVNDGVNEIRVPLSAGSVAGYVALTQKAVLIRDVYDDEELKRIHPDLRTNKRFDLESGYRTRSMIAMPIKADQVMLGVLQVINHTGGGHFSREDALNTMRVAQVVAQKLRYELNSTRGPFELLIQRNYLTREQLAALEEQARERELAVTTLLIDDLRIPARQVGESLEHYYQVPYIPFDPETKIPRALVATLSEAYLRRQLWVPISGDRKAVTVLVDDPTNTAKILEIERLLRADKYTFAVGLPEDILNFLSEEVSRPAGAPAAAAPAAVGSSAMKELVGRMVQEHGPRADLTLADSLEEPDKDAPAVVQLVNRLIEEAARVGASDIHIEPMGAEAPTRVRMRVDGVCQPLTEFPASHAGAVVARVKVMARLDITERRKPQDGKMMVRGRGRPLELRVATLPTVRGEGAVLRILASSEPLPLSALNLAEEVDGALRRAVARPHGIILVVGPTGSGKTTTLHALLGHINTPERKIWTAEDPVEITQPGLQQLQIHPKIGLTFAAALRSFLRADPDVIMIGEMRDSETAEAGVEASLTGHLVLSTLHTNSAPETVVRLLELGLDPVNFADALVGVLAQRLVRTLCSKCKRPEGATEAEITTLRYHYGEAWFDELKLNPQALQLYRPVGCPECNHTGYRGRTGIHEFLTATPEVQHLIYNRGGVAQLRETAMKQGMRTLRQDAVRKILRGQIDLEQLMRTVGD